MRNLHDRLEELHEELEHTDSVESDAQPLLREVLSDIRELLERSGESPHSRESLIDRLREATRDFEEQHPRLAAAVGRVADALANMGI